MSTKNRPKKRQTTAKRKQGGKGKPFVKGDPRANVSGRPLLTPDEREVKELARSKSLGCIERLEDIAGGSGMPAVRANEILLERAWGKPKQELEHTTKTGGVMIMLPPKDE